MSLTWHIVAKDLRRLRIPIAVWMLSYVVQFALGARLLAGGVSNANAFQQTQATSQFLSLVQFVVGFMLIPELILDDPLVGTLAFWPTRPISGARLLGAKLLACALVFGLLPSLISLPWWLYCGYGGREIAQASLHTMGYQVIPVGLGLLVASLTGNLSRFIGWTFLLVVGVALAAYTLVTPVTTHLFFHGLDQVANSATNLARCHLFSWLALLGCTVVVVHQFLTRRIARSLVLLACLLGFLAVEVTWWPLDPAVRLETSPSSPDAPGLDKSVTVQPKEGPWLHLEGDYTDKSDGFIYGTFEVGNATPEMLLRFDPPVFEWRWPDGRVSREAGKILATPRWEVSASPYQIDSVLPHKMASERDWERTPGYQSRVRNGSPKTWEEMYKWSIANHGWDYYVEVPKADGLRMLADPSTYGLRKPADPSTFTLELRGEYLRPKLQAELPLAAGHSWSEGSQGFRIIRSDWSERDDLQEVLLVEHWSEIGKSSFNPFGFSNPSYSDSAYAAVNRPEGESTQALRGNNYGATITIGTVAIELRGLMFSGPSNRVMHDETWDKGKPKRASYKAWFTYAVTLARVTEAPDGSFLRKMPVENFTLALDTFSKPR